jgi:TrmH family RNA methyltransferase
MVSKSQIKFVCQLAQKKQRDKANLFVAEGHKSIHEFSKASYEMHHLYVVDLNLFLGKEFQTVSVEEMRSMSALKTPPDSLAVFSKPIMCEISTSSVIVALENIQDPGNLGTMIRLCDWFGLKDIVCSLDTVDCFNPKVVRATMGSLARINVHYKALKPWLKQMSAYQIMGTTMRGKSIYTSSFASPTILVIGNEGKGLSEEVMQLVNESITIPRYGEAESLNAAMATGIILSEIRRTQTTEK